ncbi:putative O-methyltransferase [Hypoxylon fragiforme]|uniref:putative O-methyltransferase n=1 Tax=Hypoxylon fragiforme TaxID=63214 RepID=UPI0020C6A0C2|nr:putative O-methyltransferase [Hypoxylon fragiforme]KAI2609930.1 putative O-methyltransferase [Hypoxylon fragiforme]
MSPMEGSIESVTTKLEELMVADFKGREKERLQLLNSARKMISRVETLEERFHNISFLEPIVFATLKISLDLGLWKGWVAAGGGEKSLEELAKLTEKECDLNLLGRSLRLLGAAHIIEETGEDRYKLTQFSQALGDDSIRVSGAMLARPYHWEVCSTNLPSFLAKTSYREPRDPRVSAYSDGNPEGLAFFERCMANPEYQEGFSSSMTEWSKYKTPWPQYYDTETLIQGADLFSGAPLVVDLGGHHGIDLFRFLDKHPDVPAGSLVLQDLDDVIAGANITTDKIKPMVHSLFEPQPVHGNRAYFFHCVFHDWPDQVAVQILKNIKPAMKKGYSKILISDIVIPRTGATIYQTGMDMNMLGLFSACERTEAAWTKLIEDAGLKLVKIWIDSRDFEGIIEAELP